MRRILVDLTPGILGYGGIPQDSRLLWKTISNISNTSTTGLISSWQNKHVSKPKSEIEVSAALSEILTNTPNSGLPLLQKRKSQFESVLSLALPNDRSLYPLPSETNIAVWDSIFEKSCLLSDKDLVLDSLFSLTRSNQWQRSIKANSFFPKIRYNTKQFDYLIMQTESYIKVSPNTRKIVRFHDAIPLRNPQFFETSAPAKIQAKNLQLSVEDSFFVCNSQESRRQLLTFFPKVEFTSCVIPYAVSQHYWPEEKPESIKDIVYRRTVTEEKISLRWEINEKYFVSVSTLEPRKNYQRLIQAWELLGPKAPRLVIVAGPGWKTYDSLQAMKPHLKSGRLIHLSGLTSAELRIMYSSAIGLAFPSLDEGFGFTPIEAMLCGTPTLVSDIAAHREVMGGASIYCDPYDVKDISNGLMRLLKLGRQRPVLISKGYEQANQFSMEKSLENWVSLFEQFERRD
jgi:glycosyltransferase involved in cell wall biosynthesis